MIHCYYKILNVEKNGKESARGGLEQKEFQMNVHLIKVDHINQFEHQMTKKSS